MPIFKQKTRQDSAIAIRAAVGSVCVEAASLFSDHNDSHIENLVKRLFQLPQVKAIDVTRSRNVVVISYDPDSLPVDAALWTFSDALLRRPCASALDHLIQRTCGSINRFERMRDGDGEDIVIASNSTELDARTRDTEAHPKWGRRLTYLVFGGVCFVMSIVGIMTPFVPTMPFVLATGYYLANSSPKLHSIFRRSPLFGEMLCDWEDRGGWRLATKLKLFGLMAFLWAVTLAIAGFSWPLVITMGLVSGISVVMILRVPTIPASVC